MALPNAYHVPQAFERMTRQRPLPKVTLSTLVAATRNYKRGNFRYAAVKVLAAHCHKHPCQVDWFQYALEDPSPGIRELAARTLLQITIKTRGEKQALVDILRDKTRPVEIRRQAARQLSYKFRRDAAIQTLRLSLADDPLSCVVLGTGRALEEMKRLKDVLSSMY